MLESRVILSLVAVAYAFGIWCIAPKANNAGPDSLWALGKSDPFRNMICKEDGTLRRHVKTFLYAQALVLFIVAWVM